MADYAPAITAVAARPMAAIGARVTPGQMGHVVFGALERVHAVVRTGDYGPYWGDVVLCEGEDEHGVLDLKIGVGLARAFPGVGAVTPWVIPGGEAVQVTHMGAWSRRGAAHEAARAGAETLGRRLTGAHWEVHGSFDPVARARRTDVYYELAND